MRALISSEVQALEGKLWGAAEEFTQQGYECNAGTDQCRLGQKGKMKVVQASPADMALLKKTVTDITVPKWAERCSAACIAGYNASVGPLVNIMVAR